MDDATIFALSSGAPPAAIGIIRVSGARAGAALTALAGRIPAPRRATLGWLADPATGERLDRALLLWFPGPRTATGEDLAELHLHGGRAVIDAVSAALARLPGLRAAQPGEFTRRAFANGVIDLSEAEGLADLLAAETESQRRNAQLLAGGAVGREVAGWQERLLAASAQLEAAIEFDEGEDLHVDIAPTMPDIAQLAADIDAVLARPLAERLRDGVRVVLAGPPNAGKSTLLNAIVGRDAAIVSSVAGTTRDLVEASAAIAGVPFVFTDTAGLHEDASDRIERIGVERAREALDMADVVFWLGLPEDAPQRAGIIRVHARCDAAGREVAPKEVDVVLSATTGAGMPDLVGLLLATAASLLPSPGEVALNRRQRAIVAACSAALQEALAETDTVLAAEGLRCARIILDDLTGRGSVEDVLDALFSRFCIGK